MPTLHQDGAAHYLAAALPLLPELETTIAVTPSHPGVRLRALPGLAGLLTPDAPIGTLAAAQLGPAARPVRAVLFDKTPATNWALGWHQDRTVAVEQRHDLPGWGPWSVKAGIQHVEPPFAVIERMVTLRIHLDPVPADNAPLSIAPGSHRLGRVPEQQITDVVAQCGTMACLAERGDVWVYATSILHAPAAATGHAHRRVLQVDFAAGELDPPLGWAGI